MKKCNNQRDVKGGADMLPHLVGSLLLIAVRRRLRRYQIQKRVIDRGPVWPIAKPQAPLSLSLISALLVSKLVLMEIVLPSVAAHRRQPAENWRLLVQSSQLAEWDWTLYQTSRARWTV